MDYFTPNPNYQPNSNTYTQWVQPMFIFATICPGPYFNHSMLSFRIYGQYQGYNTMGTEFHFNCFSRTAKMIGNSWIKCLDKNKWSSSPPICQEPGAPLPPPTADGCQIQNLPQNLMFQGYIGGTYVTAMGSFLGTQLLPVGTSLRFSCWPPNQFQLDGTEVLNCLASGLWSQDFPKCISTNTDSPGCKAPALADSISVQGPQKSPDDRYSEGTRLEFFCFPEDIMQLEGEKFATCQKDGKWSSPPPKCKKRDSVTSAGCTKPDKHQNLKYVYGQQESKNLQGPLYPPGTILKFNCAPEVQFTMEGNPVITCGKDGKWSSEFPKCAHRSTTLPPTKPCPPPTLPDNLKYTYHLEGHDILQSPKLAYVVGDALTFYCESDLFAVEGEGQVVCMSTGEWSKPIPTCQPKPTDPPGYDIGCLAPNVSEIATLAATPQSPRERYPVGTVLAFNCLPNDTYAMQGDPEVTCTADFLWDKPFPTCQRIDSQGSAGCPRPPLTEALHYKGTASQLRGKFPEGTLLTFYCRPEDKYTLIGERQLVCQSSGKYNVEFPTCSLKPDPPATDSCDGFPADMYPQNVITYSQQITNQDKVPVGTVVKFTCKHPDEYTMEGTQQATCVSADTWGMTSGEPLCVPIPGKIRCRLNNLPSGVRINGQQQQNGNVVPGRTVQFRCVDQGKILVGATQAECRTDGNFNVAFPHCDTQQQGQGGRKCYPPGVKPPLVFKALRTQQGLPLPRYDVGAVVGYSCVPASHYSLEGTNSVTCLQTGLWDEQNIPFCKRTSGTVTDTTTDEPGTTTNEPGTTTNEPDTTTSDEPGTTTSEPEPDTTSDGPDTTITPATPSTTTANPDGAKPCLLPPKVNTLDYDVSVVLQEGTTEVATGTEITNIRCTEPNNYVLKDLTVKSSVCQPNGWDVGIPIVCEKRPGPQEQTCDKFQYKEQNYPALVISYDKQQDPVRKVPVGAKATFSCNPVDEYKLEGITDATCTGPNTWDNSTLPVCTPIQSELKCSLKNLPPGVKYTAEDIRDGERVLQNAVVKFSCSDEEMILNGKAELTCRDDGNFDFPFPSCEPLNQAGKRQCYSPRVRLPLIFIPQKDQAGNPLDKHNSAMEASYGCQPETNYDLTGARTIICERSGLWNVLAIPRCVKKETLKTCDIPDVPEGLGATVTSPVGQQSNDTKVALAGSVIQYYCKQENFQIVGVTQSVCTNDGTWNTTEVPTCRRKQQTVSCPKPTLPQGVGFGKQQIQKQKYSPGDVISYICLQKNQRFVEDHSRTTCKDDGNWDLLPPTCQPKTQVPKKCSLPTVSKPLTLVLAQKPGDETDQQKVRAVEIGREAVYNCVPPENFVLVGVGNIKCMEGGKWDNDTIPMCEPKPKPPVAENTCPVPEVKEPLKITITHKLQQAGNDSKRISVGSSVAFSCLEEYVLVGEDRIQCMNDGNYDKQEPVCVPEDEHYKDIKCNVVPVSSPLKITLNAGKQQNQIVYEQNVPLSVPFKTLLTYSCEPDEDFELIGLETATCTRNGTWSHNEVPECAAVNVSLPDLTCNLPDRVPPLDYNIINSKDAEDGKINSGGSIHFFCRKDDQRFVYILIGNESSDCVDGQWSNDFPTCQDTDKWECGASVNQQQQNAVRTEIDGKLAEKNTWPWHAAIQFTNGTHRDWHHVCSGVILSKAWVLTAASCLTVPGTTNPRDTKRLMAMFGSTALQSFPAEREQQRAQKVFLHPKYDPKTKTNNIALMQLENRLKYTNRAAVSEICLPPKDKPLRIKDEYGVTTGWRGYKQVFKKSGILTETWMTIAPEGACPAEKPLSPSEFCAFLSTPQKLCTEDIGSPFSVRRKINGVFRYILVGINSRTAPKCGKYNVYERIRNHIDFIQNTMTANTV